MMAVKTGALFLVVSLHAMLGSALECPRLTDRVPDGPATAIAVNGQSAYLGSGATVLVLDMSEPATPTMVGRVEVETVVRRLVVEDDLAYVVAGMQGVTLIDVSEAAAPIVTSRISFANEGFARIDDVAAVGRVAYFAASGNGLRVFDVSDPWHPVEIGAVEEISGASSVAATSTYAYVLVHYGLQVVDVSDPTSPTVVSTMPFSNGYGDDVVVDGSMIYIAGQDELKVVDVSDPAAPIVTGTLAWPFTTDALDLAVWDNLAYVSGFNSGVQVIDVSDSSDPLEVARLDFFPSGVAAMAERLLATEWHADLRVFDVSIPAAPVEIGSFDTPGPVTAVAVDGARGVAAAWDGVRVFDTTDPADMVEIGAFHPNGEWGGGCIDLEGDHAFVCDVVNDRVVVLDISNPQAVAQVAVIDANRLKDLDVVPPYAYIQADALIIVDVSDPTDPIQVSVTPGFGRYVEVELPYLYSTGWTEGLFTGLGIIDVSDPTLPRAVGGAFGGDITCCSKAAVSQSWVYILGWPSEGTSLFTVDARDPSEPVVVGETNFGSYMPDIAVSGYVGLLGLIDSGYGTLLELDLTDPGNPEVVGRHATTNSPVDIYLADGHGYVAEGSSGFEVFELCSAGRREVAWLEIAAHGSGKNGSEWRTDAVVRNLGTVEADLELTLHADGVEYGLSNSVAARAQAVFEDVVGMMGVAGKGAIEVQSSQPVSLLGRIYTESNDGTLGQYLQGAAPQDGLAEGEGAWLHGLRQFGQIWRSNLSFTNTGLEPANVQITLFGTDGAEIFSFELEPIGPREVVQELSPLANRAGRPDIGWAMAKVEVTAGEGVLVSGSVIDSRTNDPTTIPMIREER